MAAYLSLQHIDGTLYAGPSLLALDERLCTALSIPLDPINFCLNWYNTIGLALSVGKTYPQIRDLYRANLDNNPHCAALLNWFERNITNQSYISH